VNGIHDEGVEAMRSLALLTVALCVFPHIGGAVQIPLAASHAALRSVSKTSDNGGPRLSELRFFETPSAGNPTAPNRQITQPLTAGDDIELLNDEAKGGARVGTILGWVVGMTAGQALFAGNDLGCNKYGECYGRLGSGDAVLAGALVMGAAGFVSGTLLGRFEAPEWCGNIPLDSLDLGFAPDGKPGVKMIVEVRF
jgi:hypothetical protein